MYKRLFKGGVLIAAVMLTVTTLTAQSIVNRVRLGNVVEDATYITSGPYAKQFVYLDGCSVMGVPNGAKTSARPHVLFETTQLPLAGCALRGISYVSESQEFVFTNNPDPYTLYFTDVHGKPTRTLSIQWPAEFNPTNAETIRWVPFTDSSFPGKYLMAVNDNVNWLGYVAVINQVGFVERLIAPSTSPDYVTAVAYVPPNRLIFGRALDDTISAMDLDGNVTVTVNTGYYDVEGVTAVDSHTLLSISHASGKVIAFDTDLKRFPSRDRDYSYGFGTSVLRGIAWDNDLFRFVLWGQSERAPFLPMGCTLSIRLGLRCPP